MRARLDALGVPVPAAPRRRRPPTWSRSRDGRASRSCSRPSAAATTARASGSSRPRRPRTRSRPPRRPASRSSPRRRSTSSASCGARRPLPHGQAVAYPVVESMQVDGVCDKVIAPAPDLAPGTSRSRPSRSRSPSPRSSTSSGILAVELFETRDGRILVNELAMRPHNSGHWTHGRRGRPASSRTTCAPSSTCRSATRSRARRGRSWSTSSAATTPDLYAAYLHCMARDPRLKVHMYGKDVKPGRKVGHVNTYGDDLDDVPGARPARRGLAARRPRQRASSDRDAAALGRHRHGLGLRLAGHGGRRRGARRVRDRRTRSTSSPRTGCRAR